MRPRHNIRLIAAAWAAMCLGLAVAPAHAQRIENGVAVFAALDKVTARISRLPIKLGETVRFGALKLTPRACYTRQPTEPPKTTTFVEVEEIQLDGSVNKIFSGWMFAESPGLNAVEHPVFDVWLTECIEPTRPVAATKGPPAATGQKGPQPAPGRAPPGQPAPPPSARDLPPGITDPELPEEPIRRPRPRR
ncbi:MAG: DUF2155 domain-containing protein [Hyphomicrobiaceae bacterium]